MLDHSNAYSREHVIRRRTGHSDDYLTQFPIFARFDSDPLSSRAPSINVVRIQRQGKRANPATTITQCERSLVRPGRAYRLQQRRNVRVVMAYNWTRKISPRPLVRLGPRSVAASAEMRSATRSTAAARPSSYIDYNAGERHSKRKKEREREKKRMKLRSWKRDNTQEMGRWTDGRDGRTARDSGAASYRIETSVLSQPSITASQP